MPLNCSFPMRMCWRNDDLFFFQAASLLCVPAEMLDFKFRVMKRRGYKLESPIVSHGDFLKNIERGWGN